MPSPIELLRNGIDQQDWNLVRQGFGALTGEVVGKKRGRPKKIKLSPEDDDGELTAEEKVALQEDNSRVVVKKEYRPPWKPPAKVVCSVCQKEMNPTWIPPRLDAQDEKPRYVCDGCVARGAMGRR